MGRRPRVARRKVCACSRRVTKVGGQSVNGAPGCGVLPAGRVRGADARPPWGYGDPVSLPVLRSTGRPAVTRAGLRTRAARGRRALVGEASGRWPSGPRREDSQSVAPAPLAVLLSQLAVLAAPLHAQGREVALPQVRPPARPSLARHSRPRPAKAGDVCRRRAPAARGDPVGRSRHALRERPRSATHSRRWPGRAATGQGGCREPGGAG